LKKGNDFYVFYLSQHQNKTCRRLHFIGTFFALSSLCLIAYFNSFKLIFIPVLFGYLPAWIGHLFFEKNKPATFKYPLRSLLSDFRMFYEILTRKIPW